MLTRLQVLTLISIRLLRICFLCLSFVLCALRLSGRLGF